MGAYSIFQNPLSIELIAIYGRASTKRDDWEIVMTSIFGRFSIPIKISHDKMKTQFHKQQLTQKGF